MYAKLSCLLIATLWSTAGKRLSVHDILCVWSFSHIMSLFCLLFGLSWSYVHDRQGYNAAEFEQITIYLFFLINV